VIIEYSGVRSVDNFNLTKYIRWKGHREIVNGKAGIHHYKLLSYLSMKISNGLIFEFGTHYGTSSLALSVNKSNKIITYDVIKGRPRQYGISPQPENVELRIGDIFKLRQEREMLKADLIFVDVDHSGSFEWNIYSFLSRNRYEGLLLLDDIGYNHSMKSLWNTIDHRKYDITKIGHLGDKSKIPGEYAGTGLVDFSNNVQIIRD
jgi:predicted O-methyltransferase YrrM